MLPAHTPPQSTPVIEPALTASQNGEPETDTKQNRELEVDDKWQKPSIEEEGEPRVKAAVWNEEQVQNGVNSSPTRQVRQCSRQFRSAEDLSCLLS